MSDLEGLTKDLQKVFEMYGGQITRLDVQYGRRDGDFFGGVVPMTTDMEITVQAQLRTDMRPTPSTPPEEKPYEIVRRGKTE